MKPEDTSSGFIPGSTFTGVFYPRFDSMPDGPQSQSMVLCQCGAYWKYHRFRDGACPVSSKLGDEVEIPEELK